MPTADSLRTLVPIFGAMALLLTAGVAAAIHLTSRREATALPWKLQLSRFARSNPWRWSDLLFLLLVLVSAQLLRPALSSSVAWDMLAFQGVLIAGFVWRARGKRHPFGIHPSIRSMASQAVVRWLAILPLLWFVAFTWQLLLVAVGHAPDFQEAVHLFLETEAFPKRAAFVFFAVVLAPIAEEGLFRGVLLPLLVRRTGALAGLVLTTLGFAALHADLGTFLPLAVLSVALSLAYVRTGTLWVPIGMHALFNAANLALLLALDRAGGLP